MFTKREEEIAKLVAQTYTNVEIAKELGISVNTVKSYLKIIYQKEKIKNRKELKKIFQQKNAKELSR